LGSAGLRGCASIRWAAPAEAPSLLADSYIQLYAAFVRFAWDRRKSSENLRLRGFDFEFASLIFEGPTLERQDQRRDYGESRVIAIGLAQGIAITVVYTDRVESGAAIRRIISARLSNRRERQAYFEALAQE
jgi:uncharacterized DUF497 family protein